MATKKVNAEEVQQAPRARLHQLTISNFRSIGEKPVVIELDDIVVLVGPNNAGKSSVLRAYEVVMQSGKAGYLETEDFPNAEIPEPGATQIPTIELETVLYADSKPPAAKWIATMPNGDRHVRERWTWTKAGPPTKKVGFNVETNQWDEVHGPWGAPGVAQANRPEPHRIEAFDNPEQQAEKIVQLLQEAIKERLKELTSEKAQDGEQKSSYELLLESVKSLQKEVAKTAESAIDGVKRSLNDSLAEVFPGYVITLDARPEDDVEKAISLLKNTPALRMGPSDGHQSSLERQGSGARRTLLWTALRILAEYSRTRVVQGEVSERPHLLLLDEPEMCLHPNAIRDACNVLYALPSTKKWQVMVTTHSPVFIDLSRDNTSIVRVQREVGGRVSGTTIFRPSKSKLSQDDKEELKLLNMYDPHVAEFFFGGRTIIVEGDTEHSAFKELIKSEKERFKNVHVVRARGKFTIVALCKILNQFGNPYAVLHDADTPTITTKKGVSQKNPAWAANEKIRDITQEAPGGASLVASLPNFECAMFGEAADGEKPYAAWEKVRNNAEIRGRVAQLLSFLVNGNGELPQGAVQWRDQDELALAVSDHLQALALLRATTEVQSAVAALPAG
ncbi:MAG: ATP-dependent nuclease [Telluria sp.]